MRLSVSSKTLPSSASIGIADLVLNQVLPGSTQLAQNANDIVTSLVHLKREIIHQDVKPFRLQYDPGQGLPRTNCANETRQGILIRDVRSFLKEFSFEKNGFAVLNTKTQMTPDDFNDKDRVRDVFYEEIKQLLSQYFADAKHIVIMEHQASLLWQRILL